MNRITELIKFLEYDNENNSIIEPENRFDNVMERLVDTINLYNPGTVIKAGLGNPELLIKHPLFRESEL